MNGLTLVEATHEEVVNLIKLRKTLTLTLKGEELLQVISLTTKDHINVVASKNEGCISHRPCDYHAIRMYYISQCWGACALLCSNR